MSVSRCTQDPIAGEVRSYMDTVDHNGALWLRPMHNSIYPNADVENRVDPRRYEYVLSEFTRSGQILKLRRK